MLWMQKLNLVVLFFLQSNKYALEKPGDQLQFICLHSKENRGVANA